jgi:CheY-like chemotaxis protein
METRTILLAEDDAFVRDVYSTRLENEGYRLTTVTDGRAVIKHLQENIPDAILLDIMMPYMDGMEVLEELQKNEKWKDIPVLMLTNLSEKENIQKALKFGVKDYLIKSHFTPSEIVTKVNLLFEREL